MGGTIVGLAGGIIAGTGQHKLCGRVPNSNGTGTGQSHSFMVGMGFGTNGGAGPATVGHIVVGKSIAILQVVVQVKLHQKQQRLMEVSDSLHPSQ